MNMQYNYRKLQVLMGIKTCTDNGIHANYNVLLKMIDETEGLLRVALRAALRRYHRFDYISCYVPKDTPYRAYKLTDKGVKSLNMFYERYCMDKTMNMRWKGDPVDFKDDGILLPGLAKIEAKKKKGKQSK